MKACRTCKREKEDSAYFRRKDGDLSHSCVECCRELYPNNFKDLRDAKRVRRQELVAAGTPCAKCGRGMAELDDKPVLWQDRLYHLGCARTVWSGTRPSKRRFAGRRPWHS